jgi:hypothetical protein
VYVQISTVKYDVDQEIMNIYENLQIVWSQFFTDMQVFLLLWISIDLLVFGFVANEYKWTPIWSLLTICNIWSGIQWMTPKVKKLFAVTYSVVEKLTYYPKLEGSNKAVNGTGRPVQSTFFTAVIVAVSL